MEDLWQGVAHIRCMATHSTAMFSGERTCAVRGRLLSNKVHSSSNFCVIEGLCFLMEPNAQWRLAL